MFFERRKPENGFKPNSVAQKGQFKEKTVCFKLEFNLGNKRSNRKDPCYCLQTSKPSYNGEEILIQLQES